MVAASQLKPKRVFQPGYFIAEELQQRDWTQADLASVVGLKPKDISLLISGKQSINLENAQKLAIAFGQSPQFWLSLQLNYNLQTQQKAVLENEHIAFRASLFNLLPVKELEKKGWIPQKASFEQLKNSARRFLGTDDLAALTTAPSRRFAAFRKSNTQKTMSESAAEVWLNVAQEIAQQVDCPPFDRTTVERLAEQIPEFSTAENGLASFLDHLSNAGVIFFCLPHLSKTYLDGAAFFSKDRPCIVLTGRFKRKDSVWFTLAHELGHVLLHLKSSNDCFLDNLDHADESDKIEQEADAFASRILQQAAIKTYFENHFGFISEAKINACAGHCSVHPALVAGTLAHFKIVDFNRLARFSKSDAWNEIPEKFQKIAPPTPIL